MYSCEETHKFTICFFLALPLFKLAFANGLQQEPCRYEAVLTTKRHQQAVFTLGWSSTQLLGLSLAENISQKIFI